MNRSLTFRVVGTPAPQGSKRHVGGGRLIESSAAVEPWRHAVALQTRATMNRRGSEPLTGPIRATLIFLLHRPKSLPKRITHPDRRPDLDKLIRATLDALTESGIIRDDAQICDLSRTRKMYAPDGAALGAWITLETLP